MDFYRVDATLWGKRNPPRWSAIVRASSPSRAIAVAWHHPLRPRWVKLKLLHAEVARVESDPLWRWMLHTGRIRKVEA